MADDYLDKLLGTGEVVLIDTRQHWVAAILFAIKPILIVGLVILLVILNQVFDFDGFLSFINGLVQIVLVIAAIAAIIWLPIDLVRWYSRHYVLTNRRVIRLSGVLSKRTDDSSLDKITDIATTQGVIGRLFGYTNLTVYTASDEANEDYNQLIDGLRFKKAVLDAKEAIRVGSPLQALPEGFVVKGGTNAASRGGAGAAATATDSSAPVATTGSDTADEMAGPDDSGDGKPTG
jgi:membrane protein YdbS with pleckstrin-like domain